MADFIMGFFSGEMVKLTVIYVRNFFPELRFICWIIFHFMKLCRFATCPWHKHTKALVFEMSFSEVRATGLRPGNQKWTYFPNKKLKKKRKVHSTLTLILLTWRIGRAPNNASKWQMGFNSAFKGLIHLQKYFFFLVSVEHNNFFFILFYFDMFRPTDHHQAISTKLRTRFNAVQILSAKL